MEPADFSTFNFAAYYYYFGIRKPVAVGGG
jgi:hypothetical protein